MFEKNIEILKNAAEKRLAIRNVKFHRTPDGKFDLEGNLKLWNDCMAPFEKVWLWENGAPGFVPEDAPGQEQPYFVFVPSEEKEPRGTIIVAHGGGFSSRTGCEGINVAWYFHKAGYNTAILSYRLAPCGRRASMEDMQRATRIIRGNAEEWNTNGKIAVMGFSAGGMMAANCGTLFTPGDPAASDPAERYSDRPDACVIGYGAMSGIPFPMAWGPFFGNRKGGLYGDTPEERYLFSPEKQVKLDTPPMFIWQTMSDDGRYGMNLARALQEAFVPYELHIFQNGAHGMAMADGENDLDMDVPHVAHWGVLCDEWLKLQGI